MVLPNDQAGRRLIGSGSGKTRIIGNFQGYLLYNAQNRNGNRPVSLIDGFLFRNIYSLAKASFTTPDPITEEGGSPTGACGCIYLPNSSWVAINNCDFDFVSGVGVYMPGIANSMNTFNLNGNFHGVVTLPITIGVWGPGNITTGKIMGCRYGIVVNPSGPHTLEDLDIERCQVGIQFTNPYPYWDRNTHSIYTVPTGVSTYCRVNALAMESCGSEEEGGAFIDATRCAGSIFTNIIAGSYVQIGTPEYGLKFNGASCHFENCSFSGGYSVAAIGFTGNAASSNIWKSVTGSVGSGGGVPWLLQSSPPPEPAAPDIFLSTYPTDGGVTLANLPATSAVLGCTAICTDSTVPAWTGGRTPVSNVGRPIVGGGTYRVTVRYGTVSPTLAATASWTTSTPNITMTANPGSVVAGMGVINVTTGEYVGKVLTYVSTALVLTGNAFSASRGSTDNLVFGTWCIAG